MANTHLDEIDRGILAARVFQRDAQEGPRVGDYVQLTEGCLVRIGYLWPYHAQVSETGSWYLDVGGHVDFTGPLDRCIPRGDLLLTEDRLDGAFSFFRHDEHRIGNLVHVMVPCRVYSHLARKELDGV